MSRPLVSIVMPTRNRVEFMTRALADARAQDWEPLEILISDNGSTDGTRELCEAAAAEDPRIRYVWHENMLGLYENHNWCLDHAQGEFISYFHDDDFHEPQMIRRQTEFLLREPSVGVVSADWSLVDDDGEVFGHRDFDISPVTKGREYIRRTIRMCRSSIGIPGAVSRREAIGDLRFREDGPIGFGDYALWFRVARNWDMGHIHERLWSYRIHRRSFSRSTILGSVGQFEEIVTDFCDEHEALYPHETALVTEWRAAMHNFIFWALAYEVFLSHRAQSDDPATVVEATAARLDANEREAALRLMANHQSGVRQAAFRRALNLANRAGVLPPLSGITRYAGKLRPLLRLDS